MFKTSKKCFVSEKIMNGAGFNSFSMIFALDEIKQSEPDYLKGSA